MTEVPATASPADYAAPATIGEALRLLSADPTNMVIAGGTDLIPATRAGTERPGVLVDLRRLPLNDITVEQDRVRLGARATFTDILSSPDLAREYPALHTAAAQVGGPPIRNRATIGGNLVHASPAADGAPPLLVYDATVVLLGPAGRREVPLTAFFEGPGRTVRQPSEIVTEIWMPRPTGPTVSAFAKLGPRLAMAVSIVCVAVRLSGAGLDSVDECRVALGAVAPTPIRAEDAEKTIVARGLTADSVARASIEAAEASAPIDDLRGTAAYRRRMVRVVVERMLDDLARKLTGAATDG